MAEISQFKIKNPSTFMIAGPSSSGKSTLVKNIIKNLSEVFREPPERIIFCYSRDQFLYREIEKISPVPISFVEGLNEDLKPKPKTLVVIDDLQNFSEAICSWFTRDSHHYNCSVIYLTQNLFLSTPHHRTCSLNAHYLIIFKNPRDQKQIRILGSQLKPGNGHFVLAAYQDATNKSYGYLCIDLTQHCDESLRYRNCIFPAFPDSRS